MNKNEAISELLSRAVSEVIDKQHLEAALNSGKKLRIKLGIDPTSPNLHIGRAVVLWKLRQFQDLGHEVVLIVGDFTGLVGDTSDKDAERPMLSEAEVKSNMKNYLDQAFKILDPKKTETHYNSEWLKKLGFVEIAQMANLFGLNEFTSRENIAKRMKAGKRVSLREVLYPLMQGYDSVAVKADVELGGTDQRFNLLAGRTIQPSYKQAPQDILMTNLLEGTDGRKMSSSWGNVINLTDEANDMFGKVMSLPDNLIVKYFEYATRVPMAEIKQLEKQAKSSPRETKLKLAAEIVSLYHGESAAKKAAMEWEKVFSKKEKPSEIEEISRAKLVKANTHEDLIVLLNLASSKSEAKRLIEQGGVKINDVVLNETAKPINLQEIDLVQVGKRKFIKLK